MYMKHGRTSGIFYIGQILTFGALPRSLINKAKESFDKDFQVNMKNPKSSRNVINQELGKNVNSNKNINYTKNINST